MKKKTEPELRQNSRNLARIGPITLLLFLFQWQTLTGQDIQPSLDTLKEGLDSLDLSYHKAWTFEEGYEKKYLAREEFSYEEILQERNWLQRVKLWFNNTWNKFLASLWDGVVLSGFWKGFFQLAPYILLLALLGLLVWLAMKYSSDSSRDRKTQLSSPSADEVLIKSDNLKELAEEALRSQDFRLALRYRYLIVLQRLGERKFILWKSSKTNHDYQKELRDTPFLGSFTEVTRIYNVVWYGHFDVDLTAYRAFEKAFTKLDQLS